MSKHIAIKPETRDEVMAVDCQDCGCCCRPLQDGMAYYARLTEEDIERLRKMWPIVFRLPMVGSAHLRTRHTDENTVCELLRGDIGERCECSVYEHRPQVCRDFAQGSRSCIGMRTYFLHPEVQKIRRELAERGDFLKPFWLDVPEKGDAG